MSGCELDHQITLISIFVLIFPPYEVRRRVLQYLCCLGVPLQLVQLCVTGLEEPFQDRVVMQAALSPDQIHAFAQLSNVQ